MRLYFRLITIAVFLSVCPIAQGQEHKLDKFIDDFVSKPYSLNGTSFDDRFLDAQYFLCKLTKPELRLIRNAIFASNGYIFKDPALRDYFSSNKWYQPTTADLSEIELSSEEEANIKYIKDLESDPSFADFLKLFKKSKLPLTITPSGNFAIVGQDLDNALPPKYFIKFFKGCPGLYPYYQQNLIFQNSNFIAITYGVAVPAGAGYYAYQLVTFTPKGELIDEIRLGSSGGEIGSSWTFTALINENFEIRVREITIEEDYSEDGKNKAKNKLYKDKKYLIMSNGKFKDVSTTESNSAR